MNARRSVAMPSAQSSEPRAELERQILRSLCGDGVVSEEWDRFARRLESHRWANPEHKVVYDALRALRTKDASTRREQLPAQATRMGFPDLDWREYFVADRSNSAKVDQLVDRLEALSSR